MPNDPELFIGPKEVWITGMAIFIMFLFALVFVGNNLPRWWKNVKIAYTRWRLSKED
jgi:hypothetical protein